MQNLVKSSSLSKNQLVFITRFWCRRSCLSYEKSIFLNSFGIQYYAVTRFYLSDSETSSLIFSLSNILSWIRQLSHTSPYSNKSTRNYLMKEWNDFKQCVSKCTAVMIKYTKELLRSVLLLECKFDLLKSFIVSHRHVRKKKDTSSSTLYSLKHELSFTRNPDIDSDIFL